MTGKHVYMVPEPKAFSLWPRKANEGYQIVPEELALPF